MASPDRDDLPIVRPAGAPCRQLRHNGMYIFTDGSGGEGHDDHGNTNYWCLKTMKGFGPDDDSVAARYCSDASRSCYEPT